MFFRKILLGVLSLVLILSLFSLGALATYPEKDITVIVHSSPGGTTDAMARLVTRYMG